MTTGYIDQEAKSVTGINISTGICLDNILATGLEKKYDYWFLNMDTVIRNFLSTMDGTTDKKINLLKRNRSSIAKEIAEEVNTIISLLPKEIKLYLYKLSYKKPSSIENWKPVDYFKGYKYYEVKYSEEIYKVVKGKIDSEVTEGNYQLPYLGTTLITTHLPLDLLNFTSENDVDLLESHTGVIKPKSKWSTKLYPLPKQDMSSIPFTNIMYIIMGDKAFVKPLNMKLRKAIYDISLTNRWNSTTSESKWIGDMKRKQPELAHLLKSLKFPY